MSPSLALALFRVVIGLLDFLQKQEWYQQGRAAALAEVDEEQRKRIALADAARADADALNVGDGLRTDDGHRRD